jgi:hypothetical protein
MVPSNAFAARLSCQSGMDCIATMILWQNSIFVEVEISKKIKNNIEILDNKRIVN